jgi:hypothetical protein
MLNSPPDYDHAYLKSFLKCIHETHPNIVKMCRILEPIAEKCFAYLCRRLVVPSSIMNFLECEAKVEASSQALIAVKRYSRHLDYSQEFPRQMIGPHLAAYFGLKEAMITFSRMDMA